MRVNIYIYHKNTIKSTKKGVYVYVLEAETSKGIKTLTAKGTLEPMSEHKTDLTILLETLKRLRAPCDEVHIYGIGSYVITGFNLWLDKWVQNSWKTAKNKEVANATEWQQLNEYKKTFNIAFHEEKENSYTKWMINEAENVEKTE